MEQCQPIDNHLVENWSRRGILLVLLWSEWGKKRSPDGEEEQSEVAIPWNPL